MCSNEKFRSDIEKGKVREELFMLWCNVKGKGYKDVRDDKEWQDKDVDFLLANAKRKCVIPVDVKCGDLKAGAIMIETKSGRYNNSGWYEHSKATWFVFTCELEHTDGYLILPLHRSWIDRWIQYYHAEERRIGNGKGIFVKLNDNNRYQKNRKSIIEFVKDEIGYKGAFYWYCDKNGKEIKCKDEV